VCATSWAVRGRVLLEKAKLARAQDVSDGVALPDADGKRASKGKGKPSIVSLIYTVRVIYTVTVIYTLSHACTHT
jgi:hypothetical protein